MERLHQQERLLTAPQLSCGDGQGSRAGDRRRQRSKFAASAGLWCWFSPRPCHPVGVLISMLLFMHALGCASTPAVVSKPLPSPVVSRQEEVLDPTLLQAVLGEREGDAY